VIFACIWMNFTYTLNMWLLNTIVTNSNNIFILNIVLNNILKFNIWKPTGCLLPIYATWNMIGLIYHTWTPKYNEIGEKSRFTHNNELHKRKLNIRHLKGICTHVIKICKFIPNIICKAKIWNFENANWSHILQEILK
jgi:hypothetical protein